MTESGAIIDLPGDHPRIHRDAWVAPGAVVVGNVELAAGVAVFYNAVLRAESASIFVGADTNIQDGCVFHAGLSHDLRMGERVTVGHMAIVHGCTVGDQALIGMGAILLNDCIIGEASMIAAGALVPERTVVPPGSLVVGRPGRVVRMLTVDERAELVAGADHYVGLLPLHRAGARRVD